MERTLREETILRFHEDRLLAHQSLFSHRHPQDTPPFHPRLIREFHDLSVQKRLFMCFRESGKSTIMEEGIILLALLRQISNALLLGESETRAVERLSAIKHELETNELIEELFGYPVGPTWRESKIVLTNGVCIQAVGSGQSLRGIKYLDKRPDFLGIDDVEGDKNAFTEEQRQKTRQWFFATVVPAASHAIMRMCATPLDRESLPVTLSAAGAWRTTTIPVKSIDPSSAGGEWVSSWPAKFSLQFLDQLEEEYRVTGNYEEFEREYMVQAVATRDRPFNRSHFRSEPVLRTWQPVDVFYDPARTVNRKSAMTGKAVWSWHRNRLLIWESGGYFWLPNQIVDDIFKVAAQYNPVTIGVEKDGLEEFLLQPIRHKQIEEGVILPLKAVKAPKGKFDFIKGLQPFFNSNEVIFVGDGHEELQKQLLSFPTGRIDIPNALAYALLLRPGRPVYQEFADRHVVPSLTLKSSEPVWALWHVDESPTVSVTIAQYYSNRLFILKDYLYDGRPASAVPYLLRSIGMDIGRPVRSLAPPSHFREHELIGLRAALRSAGAEVSRGGEPLSGSSELRSLLLADDAVQIQLFQASWTIRAFAGGYNTLLSPSDKSPYRLVIEALESFCARALLAVDDNDRSLRYAETKDGRRYMSALP